MNSLRFLLGVITLLVACGASRGNEWKRMPVGPAEEPGVGQSSVESGKPITTVAPFTRGLGQAGTGWSEVGVTRPKNGSEATKAKDTPGRKDERQPSFPRIKSFFGRFRGQGS